MATTSKSEEDVVLDAKNQTLEEITSEPDEEVKAIRIERFGSERYAAMTNSTGACA